MTLSRVLGTLDDLDELQDMCGGDEMGDNRIWQTACRHKLEDIQIRCVAGDDRFFVKYSVELFIKLLFCIGLFRNRLNYVPSALGSFIERGCIEQMSERAFCLFLGQNGFRDE